MNTYHRELLRPWKLATLTIGLLGLIALAVWLRIPDWDIGISILMALLTYLTAPWSVRTAWEAVTLRRGWWPLRLLLAALITLAVVDGAYVLYHALAQNPIFRKENLVISSTLYIAAGWVWSHNMPALKILHHYRRKALCLSIARRG